MILRLLSLFLIFGAASSIADHRNLTFVVDSKPLEMSTEDDERIVKMIEEIVETANFNSRDHEDPWFQQVKIPETSRDIKSSSFFRIDYPAVKDLQTVGGTIPAKQIWVLINDSNPTGGGLYPGPVYLSDGQSVIALSKYSGVHLLGLGLDSAVFPHLPPDMQKTMKGGEQTYQDFIQQNRSNKAVDSTRYRA